MIIKMNNRELLVLAGVLIFLLIALSLNSIFKKDYSAEKEAALQEKIEEFDTTNDVTEENKYSVKSINHEEMARLYFNDYKNMIVNYPDEAYDIIINSDEISKEDFLEYRDQILSDYYNYNYASYSYYQELTTNCYVYRVTNNNGEIFTFKTQAVMIYQVNITI